MQIKSKIGSLFVSVLFVAVLVVLFFATVFRQSEEFSFWENRNLTSFPAADTRSVMNGEYFTALEKYLSDHAAGRTTLIKLNTKIDLDVLKKPVVNGIVVEDDILLPVLDRLPASGDTVALKARAEAEIVSSHRDKVESYGGKYCYVAVPCQYVCFEDKYPTFLYNRSDYTEATSKAFFGDLESLGVDYIDMKKVIDGATDAEKLRLSSTVDNHFSIFGGYSTYREMIRVMNENGVGAPLYEEKDFDVKEVENPYLGSRGRKLFGYHPLGEKLYLMYPKETIPFTRTNGGIAVAPSVYTLPSDPYSFALYSVYMGGDIPETVVDTGREELPSVLIYGDSFTNAVESVAWVSFDKMYSLDMRYYGKMTVDEYIEQVRPDYVFCIRDYEVLIERGGNGE